MNIATFGNFFGVDTLIIFLVILLLFGAKKLPELAKGMGQAVREFTKAKDDIEREVTRPPEQLHEPKFSQDPDPVHGETHGNIMHGETTPAETKQTDPHETTRVS
jgi:sec-independent protein translocase protein TatA